MSLNSRAVSVSERPTPPQGTCDGLGGVVPHGIRSCHVGDMFLPVHLLLAGTWDDPSITLVLPEGSTLPLEGKATIVEGDLGSFVEVKRPGPRCSAAPPEAARLQASGWMPEANNEAAEGVVFLQKGVHHVALSSAEGEGETTV